MEHLPPKAWEDVATKGDLTRELSHLKDWVEVKLEALRHELRGEMHATLRTHTLTIIGAMVTLNGAVVALLR